MRNKIFYFAFGKKGNTFRHNFSNYIELHFLRTRYIWADNELNYTIQFKRIFMMSKRNISYTKYYN